MIRKYFEEHKAEIIEDIEKLVAIPSVREKSEEGAPFGKPCAEALDAVKNMYDKNGFETELYSDDGYLLSYYRGGSNKRIGLFSHSDVVPAGDDWVYTEPFKMLEKDGFLFGRGVEDNISGIIATLYAARAIRDLKIPFDSTIVMFTGSSEETGMEDIMAYGKKHKFPDVSLVPDMGFPVCRGEAGICHLWAESPDCNELFESLEGGNAFNIILGKAKAVIKYDERLFDEICKKKTEEMTVTCDDDRIILEAVGASKHVGEPEGSVNAAYFIFKVLSRCDNISEKYRKILSQASVLLETPFGYGLAIAREDDDFGKLSCGNGMVRLENGRIKLSFDIRYPASVSADFIENTVADSINNIGWEMKLESNKEGYVHDKNSPLITAMEKVYRDYTGNKDACAFVSKGGTYARKLKNAVGIGTECFIERPFDFSIGHGGVHQADECISIKGLLDAMAIITEMILACDKL